MPGGANALGMLPIGEHGRQQRFVGHLGKDSMAARSICFSVIMYFYGISSMWAAISTKIGRAVGAKDYSAIGKYFKMAIRAPATHAAGGDSGCASRRLVGTGRTQAVRIAQRGALLSAICHWGTEA